MSLTKLQIAIIVALVCMCVLWCHQKDSFTGAFSNPAVLSLTDADFSGVNPNPKSPAFANKTTVVMFYAGSGGLSDTYEFNAAEGQTTNFSTLAANVKGVTFAGMDVYGSKWWASVKGNKFWNGHTYNIAVAKNGQWVSPAEHGNSRINSILGWINKYVNTGVKAISNKVCYAGVPECSY
jgi:hypothetical protein